MKLHHFLPPPHMAALFASSLLAFAAGAWMMSRRRLPVRAAAIGRGLAANAKSWRERVSAWREARGGECGAFNTRGTSSGNAAFDSYREETLRKLEAEAKEFRDYLNRLRASEDREAFDAFLNERRGGPAG